MKFAFSIGTERQTAIAQDECSAYEYNYAYYWTILSSFVGRNDVDEFMKNNGMLPQSASHLCLGTEWLGPKQSRVHFLSLREDCEFDYHKCVFAEHGHDGSNEAAIKQFLGEFDEETSIILPLHENGFFTPSISVVQRVIIPNAAMPGDWRDLGETAWEQ